MPSPPPPPPPVFTDRRAVAAWCLYDFANSSFSAVIAATLFSMYFAGPLFKDALPQAGTLWWSRILSVSMLFVAVTSPFLGGIADLAGLRKGLLLRYTLLSVGCVALFSTLKPGMHEEAIALALLANIGMEGALVFYNSYLPEIAPPSYQGRVSSWGFATGYLGSLLSLLLCLPLVLRDPQWTHPGLIWIVVACFFLVFSIPALIWLPANPSRKLGVWRAARRGFRGSLEVLKEMWGGRDSRLFLLAYLLYEDGVQTVIFFSSIYAGTQFGFQSQELLILFVVVQVSALAGALAFSGTIDRRGPKVVVLASISWWCLVVLFAYLAGTKGDFWRVSVAAGLGLGVIQAASRTFFTGFVPAGREAEYFGVFALVGKSSAVLGPFLFGEIASRTGSQRPAILSVAALYLGGLALLAFVRAGGPTHLRRRPIPPAA